MSGRFAYGFQTELHFADVRQVKCRQSNRGSPCKPLKQISQIAYMVKVVSQFIKQSV